MVFILLKNYIPQLFTKYKFIQLLNLKIHSRLFISHKDDDDVLRIRHQSHIRHSQPEIQRRQIRPAIRSRQKIPESIRVIHSIIPGYGSFGSLAYVAPTPEPDRPMPPRLLAPIRFAAFGGMALAGAVESERPPMHRSGTSTQRWLQKTVASCLY